MKDIYLKALENKAKKKQSKDQNEDTWRAEGSSSLEGHANSKRRWETEKLSSAWEPQNTVAKTKNSGPTTQRDLW